MRNNKRLWIGLCLTNLCLVAFWGFVLRSKILFPIPFVDYRNVISAHSHFAFAGWVGLCLVTLLIYNLLPQQLSQKKFYQFILIGTEISSLGMVAFFPFEGYSATSIFFSSLYIVMNYVFAPVFIKDVLQSVNDKSTRLVSIASVASLLLSAIGPLGIVYILLSKSGDSILYRDSIYTFLHFQYNGFFTLAVVALFFQFLHTKGIAAGHRLQTFALFLTLSVLPALALSLLWHNHFIYYVFAAIGALFILLAVRHLIPFFTSFGENKLFSSLLAKRLGLFALVSLLLKMVLNVGTLIPSLGDAVYGNRPVIIGFLHLVFLGFVTFFILSRLLEAGYFTRHQKIIRFPFYVFSFGIIANETLLMLQGLGILFKTNSNIFNWLLWGASIFLLLGAVAIAVAYWLVYKSKKAAE